MLADHVIAEHPPNDGRDWDAQCATPLCIWSGCGLYEVCMSPDVERILRACIAQRESEGLERVPGQTELLCLEIKAVRDAMYEARSHLGSEVRHAAE